MSTAEMLDSTARAIVSECGARIRLTIAGENYYLIAVRCDDGGLDYCITVPDEHKPTGQRQRETAERICAACSALSRLI